ncbi:hypothetical protein CK500_02145 [Halorubrum salipaludis]|uniref:Lipoprotein n=1 Tax=Halorubrum salipaludis TaxID=2032630 RepID=A0A2A2FLP6_9EURY|nr:hypothetical protein [Halorubrum salipaludis]PAU85493.1 hypothetical protein CK500_02145 [Halorubrum salipaludis]
MNRRSLLAAAAALSVAGCVGAGGSPGGAGGTDAESGADAADADGGNTTAGEGTDESVPETAADPDLLSTDLVEVESDPSEDTGSAGGEAAIGFAPDEVAVAGTVVGETGCHGAEIADAAVDDDGAFRVVVAAVDRSAPDRLCTQSLTAVGYELEARFDGGVPETVAVVHDDAGGRETVATDRPDDA